VHVIGIQLDIVWENKSANHDKVRSILTSARPLPGTLVVLPEMFATGFSMNVSTITDDDGTTQQFLAGIAREYRVNVLAGIVSEGHNEAVWYDTEGREVDRYEKIHLFSHAGETQHFIAGVWAPAWNCYAFTLTPVICYDLRFPELFRDCVKRGANLFAVIANWPTSRLDHWLTLLKARAIENQAYVIGVNRCGRDPNVEYPGRSQIISPRGEVLADAGEKEGTIRGELDFAALQAYRKEFPALQDMQ
jgi:predicted amidohydrolase